MVPLEMSRQANTSRWLYTAKGWLFPSEQYMRLKPEGGLGEVIEEQTDSLNGVVREMEVNVLMSVGIAKAISTWLQGRIEQIEQAENIKQTESETDKQNGG